MAFLRTSPHSFTHAKGFPLRLCSGLTLRQFNKLTTSNAQGKTLEKGFTLVELLIVIGILAILSVAVVVVLNPAELIKQSRDSSRMSDFAAISTAMSLYTIDQPGGFTGSSSIVYVSIPDTSNTCANLGLPTLPTGYSYACSSTSTYRKVDGTGWMPLSLSSMATGAPFSVLPIDPVNTTSSGNYYTYTPSGQKYEVATPFESAKYKLGGSADRASMDGGIYTGLYESGSSLTLAPIDYGDPSLVGYWTFNEGTGTKVYDYSGHNASGTWQGTLGSQWTGGKVGAYAGNFNGTDNSVAIQYRNIGETLTYSLWTNVATTSVQIVFSFMNTALRINSGNLATTFFPNVTAGTTYSANYTFTIGTWYHIVVTQTGSTIATYINGTSLGSQTVQPVSTGSTSNAIGSYANASFANDIIDDVRIYNRALSASEILALYNATK